MSDWTSNEAKEFLSIIRGEAEKVVKDFGDRQSSVYSCLAVVTAISVSGDISVRLLSSPVDGSQDFVVRNRSGSTLEVGDSVWLHYWSDYTNVYIAMRNAGDGESDLTPEDIGAQPNNAVSTNLIINGGFDVWQRGTSFTAYGYTADRWCLSYDGTGATRAISRQAFIIGQTDVPYSPTYYLRYNQSVAGSNGTWNSLLQKIESVTTLTGRTVTLSFYAKASSSVSLNTGGSLGFGTGGSATMWASGGSNFAIGTSWTKVTSVLTFPSISGKTIGANNYSSFEIGFPKNTTFTIDIANVQLNYGSVALPFVPRIFADELRLCKRYFLKSYRLEIAPGTNTNDGVMQSKAENAYSFYYSILILPAPMRTSAGTVTFYTPAGTAGYIRNSTDASNLAFTGNNFLNRSEILGELNGLNTMIAGKSYQFHYAIDDEL